MALDTQEDIRAIPGEVIKLLAMSLGLSYFISQMLSDICVALMGKPTRHWIPARALLLTAFTIQVLTFLENKNMSFQEDPKLTREQLLTFVSNQLLVGKVVICVFIGYLLPGMARPGSAADWINVAALVVGILSAITPELYHIPRFFSRTSVEADYNYAYYFFAHIYSPAWFILSNAVLLVSFILLCLFSVSAILAGKTIRGMVSHRISAIQSNQRSENPWEAQLEGLILTSWLLARVGQPQYVIARSVLSSATGLVVTICILYLVVKEIVFHKPPVANNDGFDWLRFATLVLQWAFILIGGAVIFWRWFSAVVYFPRFFNRQKSVLCEQNFWSVEDYWTRSILELIQMYNFQKWRLQEQSKYRGRLSGLAVRIATTMKVHNLLYVLWSLQISLIYFSKCCWFISELLFGFKFTRMLPCSNYEEFRKYQDALEQVCIPGETPASLWLANETSMMQTKIHLEKSKENGCICEDLITLVKHQFQFRLETDDGRGFVEKLERLEFVAQHFPTIDENCMRMTALSLLTIIIKLFPSYKDADRVGKAVEAFKQAWDLMTFIENSDPEHPNSINLLEVIDIEADRVTVAAYNEFQTLLKLHSQVLTSLETSPNLDAGQDMAREVIENLLEVAEKQLKEQKLVVVANKAQQTVEGQEIYCGLQDSKDWNAIARSHSMYRVCKLILRGNQSSVNSVLVDDLFASLGDVIAYSLLRLPDALTKSCRNWAVQFEEDKIWEAIYIAGKTIGVLHEKCNLELKCNCKQTKLPLKSSLEIEIAIV